MHVYDVSADALDSNDIAVVGMAARLPGALDVFDFWQNLRGAVESIRPLSEQELLTAGVEPAELQDPGYVRRAAPLDRMEQFDARFFGFSRQEAAMLDPQHRHFLEVCSEAIESAGLVPETFPGAIGVFGGSGMNAYLPYNLFTNPELMKSVGLFLARHTGNDKDFLVTRVSYCLDLTGPSVNVQTACSTSLVAIHLATQSLLAHECDAALAGGVTIELPHLRGYRYEEGEILSPDGRCRPFEARSRGTVFGSGVGVVVLKRLRDAVEQGDHIHAIIKGTAVNNDGRRKVGYLAPSVTGQAACVAEALQVAGLSARDISYVECHGTGTSVGDPIEIAALSLAFSRWTTDKNFCAVGSVKSNIGHLDTAAGVASVIKVIHMLEAEQLVPTLHFEQPNPLIDFAATPFAVAARAQPWPRGAQPRRASVNALGVGGTNAHVILQEAPPRLPDARVDHDAPAQHLLMLSARSQASLEASSRRLARHLDENPAVALADVSATLLRGRRLFPFRRVLAASSSREARALLETPEPSGTFDIEGALDDVPVVFLFPGGGAQHALMARELYRTEPAFHASLDASLDLLLRNHDLALRPLLLPPSGHEDAASSELARRPSRGLPALLAVEIALARQLEHWGIRPTSMLGHSLGEYAAAHLAGVLSLDDALGVMCCRGRLFETVKRGGMLSVGLPADQLAPLLGPGLSIAVINAPELCVVSGEHADLDALEEALAARRVDARRLRIDVPAHSPLLDPILGEFARYVGAVTLGPIQRPYLSNLTGALVTADDLSTDYFVRHLRETVRFSDGLTALFQAHPQAILVEVGPGQTLAPLLRLQPGRLPSHAIVPLAPHLKDPVSHARYLRASAGRILAHGGKVDLAALTHHHARRVTPLPPTPFEHERHWVEPGKGYFMSAASADAAREPDVARWFFRTVFREEPRAPSDQAPGEVWLLLADEPLGRSLQLEALARGAVSVLVTPGEHTGRLAPDHFSLRLADPQGYDDVLQAVIAELGMPRRILHTLALAPAAMAPDARPEPALLDRCFYSLLHLAQALSQESLGVGVSLLVATARAQDVAGDVTQRPLHALAQGPVLVIPREIGDLRARLIDLFDPTDPEATARTLLDELAAPSAHALVAQRGASRHVGAPERVTLDTASPVPLPPRPLALLTGGLGGIARTLARHLFVSRGARVVLVARTGLPLRSEWAAARLAAGAGSLIAEQLDDLMDLEAMGADIALEQADLTSASQTQELIERVRARHGQIDIVVHAAGTLDDGPLALKTRESAAAVLAPKVAGSRHLLDAIAAHPPALLLLLSSSSAALGPAGQIDYAAANAHVSALARAMTRQMPSTRVIALGFCMWRATGMTRSLGPFSPTAHGDPTGHPLLAHRRACPDGSIEYETLYDASRLWVLDEHRVRGHGPVLPGTAIVEIIRAAAAGELLPGAGQEIELRDVMFVAPMEVPDGEPRLARVVVVRDPSDSAVLQVTLSSRGRDDQGDVEHARGSVALREPPAPAPLDLGAISARCTARLTEFDEGRQQLPQDQHLAFGPRWRVLRRLSFGESEALASLTLPALGSDDLAQLPLHPGLLDIASGFAFSLIDPPDRTGRVRVPLSYQRLRLHAPLTATVVSHARLRLLGPDGLAVLDVTIADPTGRVLVEIEGYTTASVAPAALAPRPDATAAQSLLGRWSLLGITRQEGAEVLERLLRFAAPADLLASPLSLHAMSQQLAPPPAAPPRRAEPRASTGQAPADGASTDGAPRDDVERRLSEIWGSLLGVDPIGIRENFFDLGGHSLVAVRLFARIKKTYGVDLPLAVLFEAPTIETCAALLRKAMGLSLEIDQAAPAEPRGELVPAADQPHAHLVAIRRQGEGLPFFCVHGAGGNVLNFRDLSETIQQHPFYGLQALGVNGEPPARSIEEMADLYLRDILDAQPHGPYLLGGYSGGGVVAYEMAQRLRIAGHEVPLLALLDTFHPGAQPRRPSLRERVAQLRREGPAWLTVRGQRKLARHLGDLSNELQILYCSRHHIPLPIEIRELQMTRAFHTLAARYQPRPYDGHVALFRAHQIADVYRHVGPSLGWQDLIPHLDVIEVPGGHDSLVLKPNVQVLAQHLTRLLDEAAGSPLHG